MARREFYSDFPYPERDTMHRQERSLFGLWFWGTYFVLMLGFMAFGAVCLHSALSYSAKQTLVGQETKLGHSFRSASSEAAR